MELLQCLYGEVSGPNKISNSTPVSNLDSDLYSPPFREMFFHFGS